MATVGGSSCVSSPRYGASAGGFHCLGWVWLWWPRGIGQRKWALSSCGVGWGARSNSPPKQKPVTQIIQVSGWGGGSRAKYHVQRFCWTSAGHDKCILVAHDFGGAIAWNFVMQHPEMLLSYVILDAPYSPSNLAILTSNPFQVFKSWYALLPSYSVIWGGKSEDKVHQIADINVGQQFSSEQCIIEITPKDEQKWHKNVITGAPGLGSRYSNWLLAGRSGEQIPVGARFSTPVPSSPGAHPAYCTLGKRSLSQDKAAGAWRWPPTPI
jgi:hypothetical protein